MFEQEIVYAQVPEVDGGFPANSVPAKILTVVRPGWHVLDVGCGGGHLAKHLAARSVVVTGVERNPEAAKVARRYCARLVEKDVRDPELLTPEDTYDAIVCADVLEHLERPDELLRRLAVHMRSGGTLIVSVPNIAYYKVRLKLLAGRFDYEPSGIMDRTHLRFFTRRTAVRLLEEAGWRPHVIDAVYGVPLGRLERAWPNFPRVLGGLAPGLFAAQWVFQATRAA